MADMDVDLVGLLGAMADTAAPAAPPREPTPQGQSDPPPSKKRGRDPCPPDMRKKSVVKRPPRSLRTRSESPSRSASPPRGTPTGSASGAGAGGSEGIFVPNWTLRSSDTGVTSVQIGATVAREAVLPGDRSLLGSRATTALMREASQVAYQAMAYTSALVARCSSHFDEVTRLAHEREQYGTELQAEQDARRDVEAKLEEARLALEREQKSREEQILELTRARSASEARLRERDEEIKNLKLEQASLSARAVEAYRKSSSFRDDLNQYSTKAGVAAFELCASVVRAKNPGGYVPTIAEAKEWAWNQAVLRAGSSTSAPIPPTEPEPVPTEPQVVDGEEAAEPDQEEADQTEVQGAPVEVVATSEELAADLPPSA